MNKNDVIIKGEELIYITDVRANVDYTLNLEFSNGERKIFNMFPLLSKKINEPLQNRDLFLKAYVECGTVVWNDELDIAPEYLYCNSV
jgi:hypothetical protein